MQQYYSNNYKHTGGRNEVTAPSNGYILPSDLKLNDSKIEIITSFAEAEKLFNNVLSYEKMLGLDSEWDSTLDKVGTAIFQIATREKSYILDFITIYNNDGEKNYMKLGELISKMFINPKITKVAFSFSEDLKNLSYTFYTNFEIESLCDLYHEVKTKEFNNNFGLKALCLSCYGKLLDKTCQKSRWSVRPLTKKQVIYAGLDAFVLLPLFDFFTQKPLYFKFYTSAPQERKKKDNDTKPTKNFSNVGNNIVLNGGINNHKTNNQKSNSNYRQSSELQNNYLKKFQGLSIKY